MPQLRADRSSFLRRLPASIVCAQGNSHRQKQNQNCASQWMSPIFDARDGPQFLFQSGRIGVLESLEIGAVASRAFNCVAAHDLATVVAENDVHESSRLDRKRLIVPEDNNLDRPQDMSRKW